MPDIVAVSICVGLNTSMTPAGEGSAGSVTSITWMALSEVLATKAYVPSCVSTIAIPIAAASASKPSIPSWMAATGTGDVGSLISIT